MWLCMNIIYEHLDFYIKYEHKIDSDPSLFPLDYSVHAHENYEIYYFISGNGVFWVEGFEYNLKPGSIMIMRPNEVHNFRVTGDGVYERKDIHFHPDVLREIDPEHQLLKAFTERQMGKNNLFLPEDYDCALVKKLFDQMEATAEDNYHQTLALLTSLFSLLWELNSNFPQKSADGEEDESTGLIADVVEYIDHHLTEILDLDLLTQKFNISKSYLNVCFKNITGSTIWQYILTKRLVVARQKIMGGASIAEACRAGGFKDYSSFYRQYRKRFGVSPKDDQPMIKTDFEFMPVSQLPTGS